MEPLTTMTYEVTGKIARITLNRPERANAITLEMPVELAACVERANLDPAVHVIALSGNGPGFCAGYDLLATAERSMADIWGSGSPDGALRPMADIWGSGSPDGALRPKPHADFASPGAFLPGSPLDPAVQAQNHRPDAPWDPTIDHAMMSRNVRGFMSLFHGDKPVVCKVHGFCVAGGTDMALCSDLLVIEDKAKIGYPPARVWGVPTTALWLYRIGIEKAKRLLFTGDCLSGEEAVAWGLAIECAPRDRLDDRFESLLARIARVPVSQLVMTKLLLNQALMAQGLHATQLLGTVFDGIARHTPEGHGFARRAAEAGFKQAVLERDGPFGDAGRSTFKG